jgi:hypothetical protein
MRANMREFKAVILIIMIMIISFFAYIGLTYIGESFKAKPYLWAYFMLYVGLIILMNIIASKIKNKILNVTALIFSIPISLPVLILEFTLPMATLLISSLLYFGLSAIAPGSIVLILKRTNYWELNEHVYTLILWAGSTIIALSFYEVLFKLTNKIMRYESSKKLKKTRLPEILHYSLDKENVRMLIYGCFFIFLTIHSFKLINGNLNEFEQIHEKAILNSFLIFLAFDRMLIYSKQIKFRPTILLEKFKLSFDDRYKKTSSEKDKRNDT